ncbi:hypothetical protein PDIG_32500 [Penicillium digitatum PHI26]|uniref:Integrase catalytic domain-containing protein n=1 Tax=Penicillium digitatum (strain PHI26 / CECT 20796) TaxID=1170229 RepID=K9GN07_PEND2|nr:hypothetical protein PDIG_32500 [Penicillium digitatum PHI26]
MADTETDNEGDTNPHPLDASTNPLEPQIPSFTNPIQFTQDDSDSEDEDNTPPHQGHGLPAIAMTKIQKVRTLEHNDTDPSGWKQALAYQLIPYALEWLLDSNIPRPHKSHTSFGRWKYWSRLVASWMYNQIDVTLQNKLRNLSKMPKYADQLYDELMSMTQGSDRMQTALIEMRKFDKMKRSDYNSASEYIEEYQRQYHVLARFKAAPHPSHGLSQVLQNIELEVMKVQFIREEVASLEPKKLTLDKVEEYWRALQAAADMEGVANATYNNNAGRGRGNGRGGRGGNRGGRGGQNNNGHNDDNTQSNKDTNAVEDDTATAKKKKKKGLRKQPADGKDIHEYANEMRNGTQKDDNNMCSFCGFGPHTAKRCAYLSENPPVSWEPSGNLWAYSKAIQRAQRQDGQNNMVVAAANSVDRRNDWLLDTGSDKTLTHDIEDFHTYQLDHPDTAYAYKDYSGNRVVTLGHGQIIVRTALPGRNGKTHSFMTTGYYTQGGHGKLLGMQKLLEEQDISYDTRTKYLTNGEGDIVGYGDTSTGVPYLVSPKDDDDPNEVKSDIDSDSDDEEIGFVNKVTAYEIHRRLGHAGKARIASTLQHAEQLGDDEQYGTEHFDCDACFQGKSKLKISRQPQARVQDVAWKFHVDTQPMKPTGPNGENYWLPVVDDASRLIEGIMLKNKSDAYYKLTAFCEKIKLLTGRYPGIWRMDGGTEFKEFIKWGEKHVKTRPDIRFAVTRLQHRLANPTFEDLHAMQHVVKYLRHMPDVGITLGRTPELRFYAHVDASHADWEDSKSTEGSIWYFAGSPVIWTTKKQTITANSTTVAEWCALDQPTRDAMWLGKIARSFMLPEQRPIEIHTDNINSQLLLTKKGGKSANRWLDLRWFFVKDAVAQGHVDIRRVDTKKNAADGFTKALAKEQFETFVGLIGMI